MSPNEQNYERSNGGFYKLGVFAFVAVLGALLLWALGDRLSFDYLASQEAQLRAYRAGNPYFVGIIAVAIYVIVAGFSLPGAVVLTLAYGWYFGFFTALLIVSFGSTGGASVAFFMTRYFLQDWVQSKFSKRLQSFNDAFDREGAFYLFTLRLIPVVPFFVINAVMGLTKIRAITFWWVSQIGMLPGTAAYVYAGASVPSLTVLADEGVGNVLNWQLVLAFAILGILPLALKKLLALVRKTPDGDGLENENSA